MNKPVNYAERTSIQEEFHVCLLVHCLYLRAWELFSLHNPFGAQWIRVQWITDYYNKV